MRHQIVLPLLYLCFSVTSLSILQSIAPQLAPIQFLFFLVGAILFWAISRLPLAFMKNFHWFAYSFIIFLLVLTLAIGVARKGATRWIPLGPITIQASQLAQPVCILTLGFFLAKNSLKSIPNIFKFFGLVGLPWFLIFIEPNLGTSLIFLLSMGCMLLCTDVSNKLFMSLVIGAVIGGILSWLFLLHPYQKQRVLSFISPDENVESSYNSRQSVIAVGSGQIWGRGLGHGVQSQLRFLPERQTDFIFASLAEELGLFGSLIVILMYVSLLGFLFYVIFRGISNLESVYILIGFVSFITCQVGVNIGMNMGILPITGITLPFISYGGSSVLSCAISFGILQRVITDTIRPRTYLIK
jgi:rod shape determining protein RodA